MIRKSWVTVVNDLRVKFLLTRNARPPDDAALDFTINLFAIWILQWGHELSL